MSEASKKRRRVRRMIERGAAKLRESKDWPARVPADPGRFNVYTCDSCGAETVTIDLHRGVTPFLFPRTMANHGEKCTPDAYVRSSFYQLRKGHGPPTFEWYAPSEAEARKAGPGMLNHARRGGLFLRPRDASLRALVTARGA